MKDLVINQDKCFVDKRKLVLDFNLGNDNWVFHYDGWGHDEVFIESLKKNGQEMPLHLIEVYKHCVQVYFDVEEDRKLFIDRRYEHNHSFDVYYGGKHYLVGEEIN